ncbi:MAG: energy transducer TonB [Brevundimonas sp.]
MLSLLAHGVPVIVASGFWVATQPAEMVPEAAFEVELVRMQAPPFPSSEQPPGPVQSEAAVSSPAPSSVVQPRLQVAPLANVEPLIVSQTVVRQETTTRTPPAPETTAPPSRVSTPAPVATSAPHTWESRVLAHLEQRKRYPAEARARRRQGVAFVTFTMDRQGRVLAAALERTSGHASLDREALSLVRRAQPLPAPPADMAGDNITLTVPVEFFTR